MEVLNHSRGAIVEGDAVFPVDFKTTEVVGCPLRYVVIAGIAHHVPLEEVNSIKALNDYAHALLTSVNTTRFTEVFQSNQPYVLVTSLSPSFARFLSSFLILTLFIAESLSCELLASVMVTCRRLATS